MDVVIEISGRVTASERRLIQSAAQAALAAVPRSHKPYRVLHGQPWTLHLALVSPIRIKTLNTQFRNKPKVTDVLSFPLWLAHWIEPEERALLGEIFICKAQAKKQCKDFGNTPNQELQRLAVHGTLHVLDYDHERSPKAAEIMFALEKKALQKL